MLGSEACLIDGEGAAGQGHGFCEAAGRLEKLSKVAEG